MFTLIHCNAKSSALHPKVLGNPEFHALYYKSFNKEKQILCILVSGVFWTFLIAVYCKEELSRKNYCKGELPATETQLLETFSFPPWSKSDLFPYCRSFSKPRTKRVFLSFKQIFGIHCWKTPKYPQWSNTIGTQILVFLEESVS